MDEQRAPNLDEMDEQQAHHLLAELFSVLNAQAEDRIRHDDYTMEWPQSGERLRGRQKMREFQEAYSGSRPPTAVIKMVEPLHGSHSARRTHGRLGR